MESLGKYLKTERELRKLTLEEVARSTKIRKGFLAAIEEDRYDNLPSTLYAKGHLTAYSKYLRLDPNDIIHRYQDCVKDLTPSKPQEVQKWILPPKKKARRWIFLIPVFAIFLTYYVSYKAEELFSPSSFEEKASRPIPVPSVSASLPIPIADQEIEKEDSQPKEEETKAALPSESPPFEVLEASIGTGIGKEGGLLVLTGKCSELICNNQRAYFFTRIKAEKKGKIAHTWLWKGREFQRIEIEVNPPTWSVYSYMTLSPQHAGDWTTEVRYGESVLNTLSFKVAEAGSNSNQEKVSEKLPSQTSLNLSLLSKMKSEFRNPKQIQNPNFEMQNCLFESFVF